MTTIANLYHTDLTTKTQLLIAENVDLEKVIAKYHPQTKETFILYDKGGFRDPLHFVKIKNNSIIYNIDVLNYESGLYNFSLNYDGDKALAVCNNTFGQKGVIIDTINGTSIIANDLTIISGDTTNVIHTGTDEQYYIAAGSTLYRYNADTQSVMYSTVIGLIKSVYVANGKLYINRYTGTSQDYDHFLIGRYIDTDQQFILDLNTDGNVDYNGNSIFGDFVFFNNKLAYWGNLRDSQSIYRMYIKNIETGAVTEINLNDENLLNPSGLATETTTNRVLFSATDNATGNRNLYELKSDNTIELIVGYEKLGGYSNNNDLMGGQLDLVFE